MTQSFRDQTQGFFGLGFDPLSDQLAYPHLDEAEVAEAAPFGERCAFAEPLFSAGDYPFNSYAILSGKVRAVDVSTGERVVFVRYGAGYFTGDIDLFTRRPAIVSVEAETFVEAVRLAPRQLRDFGCGILELARSGAVLRCVVSLHGILSAPIPAQRNAVVSKILVLHGDADPVAPAESLIDFQKEMRLAQANWQINIYSDAKHRFAGEGVVGDKTPEAELHSQSEARSWQATLEFLREVFE